MRPAPYRPQSFQKFGAFSLGGGEFSTLTPRRARLPRPLRAARRPLRFQTRLDLGERIWWDVPGWNC